MSDLPRRVYGTHLPAEAYQGRHQPPCDASRGKWSADLTALEAILAGLTGCDVGRAVR